MQLDAIVCRVDKGTSKAGNPFHVIEGIAQSEKGDIGNLRYFLQPNEMSDPRWSHVKVGSVVEVTVESRQSGFSSYLKVLSMMPTERKGAIVID